MISISDWLPLNINRMKLQRESSKDSILEDEDGTRELHALQVFCQRQHHLLGVVEECIRQLHQNDAQLDILAETANFLKKRHGEIKENLHRMKENERAMELLSTELEKVQRQVGIWIGEVKEVREARNNIEIRMEIAHGEAKKCATCGRIADSRLERIQKRHEKVWNNFITEWTQGGSIRSTPSTPSPSMKSENL